MTQCPPNRSALLIAAAIVLVAAPVATAGKATVGWTLEIRDHAGRVRSVSFHEVRPQTSVALRPFLRRGYWDISLWNTHLCGPVLCIDTEYPFDELGLGGFTNLKVTSLIGHDRRAFLLTGTMTIGKSGSITAASAFLWFCPSHGPVSPSCAVSAAGYTTPTPHPITVVAGENVTLTAEVRLSLQGA